MYTAVSAIGIPLGLNKRWQVIDLTQFTVAQLYSQFRIVQVTLLPPGATDNVYLLLSEIASQYSSYSGSFNDLLTDNGSTTLPTTPTGVILNQRSALFMDAYRAGYRADPVDDNNTLSAILDVRQLPNVRISRIVPSVDYQGLVNTCLFNVNGYYHIASTDGTNGVMIKDAIKSLLLSNQNQLALWNFANVTTLSTIPITPQMTSSTASGVATINLGVDLTNKSVALVLGGYFMMIDNDALSALGGSLFNINFNQIDLVNRYYESANYIDVSSILTATPAANPDQIVISDLVSPTAIAAWLAMSQSFFVVFNTPELFSQQQFVKKIGIPNVYLSYSEPKYPLSLALGRHPPYWANAEAGQWALKIYDNNIGNLLYNTASAGAVSTSGANQPGSPGNLQNAYFLQVGTDIS